MRNFSLRLLNVQLWKTGAIFNYEQASTSESDTNVSTFSNQSTYKVCSNSTQSTFYGITGGTATINGVSGWTAYDQSPNISLPCGT